MVNNSDLATNENSTGNIETPHHNAAEAPTSANPEAHKDTTGAHNTATESHNAAAEGHGGGNVFTELLTGIGDHHGLYIFDKHITDLPMIIYDNQEGFHYYNSEHAMEEAGQFKLVHGKGLTKTSNDLPVTLDLSVTNLVFYQWTSIIIIMIALQMLAKFYRKGTNQAPKAKSFANMVELGIEFVRDNIVYKCIPSKKLGDKLLPYFIGLHFFILIMNLLGLVPGGHTASGDIGTTAALAVISLFVINLSSIKELGLGNFLKHLTGGAPWWLWPIMIPIEIISIFTKPFALTIRLYANMTAGHVMLFSLIGLVFFFKSLGVAPITVGFSVFIITLEFLVAVLQAYIFTMLTAVFTGVATAHHDDSHSEGHTAHSH